MAQEIVEDTCPACGFRPIQDEKTGWCRTCAGRGKAEDAAEKRAVAIDERRAGWRSWTSSQEAPATRERQHAHRLRKSVTPKERPSLDADPWVLAANALVHLNRVKQSLGSKWSLQMAALDDLDEACELVRQLAVGPGQDSL